MAWRLAEPGTHFTSTESELLVVGDLVVKPGQFGFHIEGEVAR